MLAMFIYKYVYRSCCLNGNNFVPLEFVCVTVMCEGRGSNPILNTFFIQMRGGLSSNNNSNSYYVVQLNIKIEKKCYGAKTSQRQNVSAPNLLGAIRSAPKVLSAKTSQLKNPSAPKRIMLVCFF